VATEQAFPSSAPIVGGGRLLPTPAQFYVTGEDRLRIVSANAMAGVSLQLHWRHAEPSGRTVPNAQTHTPASDRSIAVTDYPLGVGSLLNVTVFAGAGAPKVGQTYVMVQLVRGTGAAAIVLGTLLAGYVTSTQALGWPGSPIAGSLEGGGAYRSIAGATPAPVGTVCDARHVGRGGQSRAVSAQTDRRQQCRVHLQSEPRARGHVCRVRLGAESSPRL